MDEEPVRRLKDTVRIGGSLFERNETASSSANMSFFHDGRMYINQSGSCLGTLRKDKLEVVDINGECLSSGRPNKGWPLHSKVYQKKPEAGAVLHIHGTYRVLWSFVPAEDETDTIPDHVPYLKTKLGKVGLIFCEKLGSRALFGAFGQRVMDNDGYLLRQHGAVTPKKNLVDAFYRLEEPEGGARITWILREVRLR